MELKQYLIDTFRYNSRANLQVLEKIKLLPDQAESIKFFSHLVNCQYKWLARILQDPKAQAMDWWNPLYRLDELENKWNDSLAAWLTYLESVTDKELTTEVRFIGFDGGPYAATPGDIALQLNYHSIHHRAQVQTIIRQQGLTPDFIDYIGTKYRKLS
ncbi:MAG TPA: DinB family protein [Ferruginibacter sp.]|nr:hypothetical protein [Chitinophagaceae bacterium]HRI23209.1 DinB family protein [Ferruginibacter sp.]